MPDAALREAAADGRLQTDEGYREQVERIFHHPRTRTTLQTFVFQWLRLDEVLDPSTQVGLPAFDAMAGTDSPTPQLRGDLQTEVIDFVSYHIWDHDGRFGDLFTGEQNVAKTDELAQLYEVPKWTEGTPPANFAAGERPGLLSRGAFLVADLAQRVPSTKATVFASGFCAKPLAHPTTSAVVNPTKRPRCAPNGNSKPNSRMAPASAAISL